DLLERDAVVVLGAAAIAGRQIEDLLVTRMRRGAAFDACHGKSSSTVGQEVALHVLGVRGMHDLGAAMLALHLLRAIDETVSLARRVHAHLAGGGEREALLGAALGLHLGHLALFLGFDVAQRDGWACPAVAAGRKNAGLYRGNTQNTSTRGKALPPC